MGSYPLLNTDSPVVFFDSHCILCNRIVRFLLKVDKRRTLKFASLSSDFAIKVLPENRIEADSIVFYHQGEYSIKSEAALSIFKLLGFPFSIISIFFILPTFLRDWVYDFIAQNRKHWFGTTEHCLVNSDDYRERIIL